MSYNPLNTTPLKPGGAVNWSHSTQESTIGNRKVLLSQLAATETFTPQVLTHYLAFDAENPSAEDDEWATKCRQHLAKNANITNALRKLEEVEARYQSESVKMSEKREKEMYPPLETIFDAIGGYCGATRKFLCTKEPKHIVDNEFPSFTPIKPDFVLCSSKNPTQVLWRAILACVEVKCPQQDGPAKATDEVRPRVKDIVAQAGDYSRVHLAQRAFQLFSISLLIYGRGFNVSVYDRGGVIHSHSMDIWGVEGFDGTSVPGNTAGGTKGPRTSKPNIPPTLILSKEFILVIRQLLTMPLDRFGREKGVKQVSGNEDATRAADTPSYTVRMSADPRRRVGETTWVTIGNPVWTSFSLLGRGTAVWKVKRAPGSGDRAEYIMKTAWRRQGRSPEADVYRLLEEKGLCGARGIADFLMGRDVEVVGDGNATRTLSVNALRPAAALLKEDIYLHRVFLKSVGKPLWEFTDPRHFVKALLAVVAGIAALERRGILHRDISAGNVLLSVNPRDGYEAFLTDFEFADAEELRTIKAVVNANHPVDVVQMPNERRVPKKATNTLTTWILERGPEMTGTMQFMAVDVLQNIIAYASTQGRQRSEYGTAPVDLDKTTDMTPRGVKHDLESLVWVAEYAVYRRAYEKAKERGDKAHFDRITNSMKQEFGQVTAEKIKAQRVKTYSGSATVLSQDSAQGAIYGEVEPPLYGIMGALLDEVEVQNMVPAHSYPDYARYQKRTTNLGRQNKIPADAGAPMTCKRMEEVLNVCLDIYCSD